MQSCHAGVSRSVIRSNSFADLGPTPDLSLDFQLSAEQEEHVHALELAAPSLAALRIEMCPEYMSETRFWKIYFVLLQSRLNKEDSELLCTPQVRAAICPCSHLAFAPRIEDSLFPILSSN